MMHFCAITKSNECSLFACFESLQCPKIVLTVIKKCVFFKSFPDPARGAYSARLDPQLVFTWADPLFFTVRRPCIDAWSCGQSSVYATLTVIMSWESHRGADSAPFRDTGTLWQELVASCFHFISFAENTSAALAPRSGISQPILLLFFFVFLLLNLSTKRCLRFFIRSQNLVAFERKQDWLKKGCFPTFPNI